MKSLREQFIGWLETKPADGEYDYNWPSCCAFAQFLRENGYAKHPSTSIAGWYDEAREGLADRRPQPFDDKLLAAKPWTFGALRSRLTREDAKSCKPVRERLGV